MRKQTMKKFVALMLTLAMCLSLNAVAFAQDTETDVVTEPTVAEDVTPRTIVGSGSAYIDGTGEFRVYCSGWSLLGNATITISDTDSNNTVNIQIFKPDGSDAIGGQVIAHTGPGVVTQGMFNANQPYYVIKVYNTFGGSRVNVSFGDR